ncbi:AAA family ATPase [Turicibacter bilis]|uniref:AAA family ATPase n=1 Tax=Turicibacter bilis TaxID=2735723 RepID=UPI0031BB47E3
MKLQQMRIKNFRQFYGEQQIIFAQDNENITIIFGENGKGKTGIFRALMYCLFGSTHLQQDDPKETIHLVNLLKLEEQLGLPVEALVEVEFEHKGKQYTLSRSLKGLKRDSKIQEKTGLVSLTIAYDGNVLKVTKDELEVSQEINNIIDEKIKDFFLFDAEKIDTLTKTDASVKEEVKTGIVKLLDIDKLEMAINILSKMYTTERKRILSSAQNLDLTTKENKIDQAKEKLKQLKIEITETEKSKNQCKQVIEKLEDFLSLNKDVKDLQDKCKTEKLKQQLTQNTLEEVKQILRRELVNSSHQVMLKDYFMSAKTYLDQLVIKQEDLISIQIIEKSLQDKLCACCQTPLEIGSKALEVIEELKSNYKRTELTPVISQMTSVMHDFSIQEQESLQILAEKITKYKQLKSEQQEIEYKIEVLNQEISEKAQGQEDLKKCEQDLKQKQHELSKLEQNINLLNLQVDQTQKEIHELEKEFNNLLRENESLKVEYKMLEHISKLKEKLDQIFNEYSVDMRSKLTAETTKIFKKLIDKKDVDLINKIEINEKYEIELMGWDNINITQDISQGQRQVVALSFITALAKVAAGDEVTIDFPLFMDTPFGRISGNNRDHLIENIPGLTSQWILLLTDTELSRVEEEKFKETKKLGRWYKLEQISKGHSQIVELSLNATMSTRG